MVRDKEVEVYLEDTFGGKWVVENIEVEEPEKKRNYFSILGAFLFIQLVIAYVVVLVNIDTI
jgi:hypothetical protein